VHKYKQINDIYQQQLRETEKFQGLEGMVLISGKAEENVGIKTRTPYAAA